MKKGNVVVDVKNSECCGCGACVNICPVNALFYTKDVFGFIMVSVNENCIMCGKCLSVCPIISNKKNYPKMAYASMALNSMIRIKSSSGGIFGTLASYILNEGGIVYGCTMSNEFKVEHIRIDRIDELEKVMRSKYVQSFLGDVYKQVKNDLSSEKMVLFSGTPCQVAAINNYIPNELKQYLYTVDIVCHGVPSQSFFDSYINELQKKNGNLEKYQFRYKARANYGMKWYLAYKIKNKKKMKVFNWPEDVYNYLYMKAYIYRDSCYNCKFATIERSSDITLCDYWGWIKYHSEFSISDSVSGVLINSDKGLKIYCMITDSVKSVETDIINIKKNNGCLTRPSNKPCDKDKLMNRWKQNGFGAINREFKGVNKKMKIKCFIMRKIPASILNVVFYFKLRKKK